MKLTARDCRGLFARGTYDECPPNFLLEATNLMTKGPNIICRPAFNFLGSGPSKDSVKHISIYNPLPTAGALNPKRIFHRKAGPAQIFNIDFSVGTPIFTPGAGAGYHSWINFYGRGYFTLHDTVIGDGTDKVQVYEGGAASRNAGGVKPATGLAGTSAVGGNLGVGKYLVDYCNISASGFISKPSGSPLAVDCFGSYKIDLTSIDVGPTGTIGRRIIVTKAIPLGTYTGNPNDYEFFFDPTNLLITDNAATTATLSFFDGNLINSADYLFDILETIPSGVGIGEYNGRMLVWGENANPSIIRVSKPGDPEVFHSINGIIVVDPTESGGVTNCIALRGTLYIFKANRIFYTIDNGGEPSTWEVKLFDAGIGTSTYGISAILDAKGTHLNQFLIAARSGIIIFDGLVRYPELTYWIMDIWRGIDQSKFNELQLVMDPIHKHIYCILPKTGGTYDLLFGDYSDGMDIDHIKWFIWKHNTNADSKSIMIGVGTSNNPIITVAFDNFVSNFDPDNPGALEDSSLSFMNPFSCVMRTPVLLFSDESHIQQINEVRVRQQGGRANEISAVAISAQDASKVGLTVALPFTTVPTKVQDKWIYYTFVDNEPTVKFVIDSSNKPTISRISIDGTFYGESDPQ